MTHDPISQEDMNQDSMSHAPAPTSDVPAWLNPLLRCPVTGGALEEEMTPDGPRLISRSAGLSFPVENGVPVLLPHLATAL